MAKITKAPKQRKAELAMFEATVSRSQTPDLSLTPEEQIAACLSKVQNRRKGFKRLRDNDKEAVWSESLEEVLLEGFKSYRPIDCRETRVLGRFPMRNQFIAEYIHRETGILRTAKQVGSRIQQLRETDEGKQLLDLLARDYVFCPKEGLGPMLSPPSSTLPTPKGDDPVQSTASILKPSALPHTEVWIDISPPVHTQTTHDGMPHVGFAVTNPCSDFGYPTPFLSSDYLSHDTEYRSIKDIDNTITFISKTPVSARSSCIVSYDGLIVHTEEHALTVHQVQQQDARQPSEEEKILYEVKLAPEFWHIICGSRDPTRYSILQKILSESNVSFSDATIFSGTYRFRYPVLGTSSSTAPREFMDFCGDHSLSTTSAWCTSMDGSVSSDHQEWPQQVMMMGWSAPHV